MYDILAVLLHKGYSLYDIDSIIYKVYLRYINSVIFGRPLRDDEKLPTRQHRVEGTHVLPEPVDNGSAILEKKKKKKKKEKSSSKQVT